MASSKLYTLSPLPIYLNKTIHLKSFYLLPVSLQPSSRSFSIGLNLNHTEFSLQKGVKLGRNDARKRRKRVVLVRANNGGGFNFNGGDKGTVRRLVGNLVFAAGLTYLSFTGQLGWVLDAIISIWVLAVVLPIVGIAAFFYFARQDIVQSPCPNCGNDFQVFKSSLTDGPQLCPYCSQPFSVKGNKFVREAARFSSEKPPRFTQAFNGFSRVGREKTTAASSTIVDVEAEVKDAD